MLDICITLVIMKDINISVDLDRCDYIDESVDFDRGDDKKQHGQ